MCLGTRLHDIKLDACALEPLLQHQAHGRGRREHTPLEAALRLALFALCQQLTVSRVELC